MSGTDRGEERRRLLEAVRTEADAMSTADVTITAEATSTSEPNEMEDRPEPAPDGGTVAVETPLFHCADCDRMYLEAPFVCDDCGETEFVERRPEYR